MLTREVPYPDFPEKFMLKQSQAVALLPEAAIRGSEVADARLEMQIWTAYALSPYLRAYDLKAVVRASYAIISGTVTEQANKELARQIAISVDGIDTVENRIEVAPHFVPPVKSGDRAFGELVADTTVTSAVRSKLAWSRFADDMHASVVTRKGRVHLSGTARNAETREAAGRLAMNTHGVDSVNNLLAVEADRSNAVTGIGAEVADSWITAKVKSTLMYSTCVAGRDITITTQRGIVSLTGKSDSESGRALTVELAGNVRGVKSVDSRDLTT